MSQSQGISREAADADVRELAATPAADDGRPQNTQKRRRVASVYDAAAGRVGLNGFLTASQQSGSMTPLAPEDVLLRRVNAPASLTHDFYNSDERLEEDQALPESDLLKAFHAYTSDFYAAATNNRCNHDYRSLDDSALLAFGILLEEAARESLGENGDMALAEPSGLEHQLPESRIVRHQIQGRVKPPRTPEYVSEEDDGSDSDDEQERVVKKRRLQRNEKG